MMLRAILGVIGMAVLVGAFVTPADAAKVRPLTPREIDSVVSKHIKTLRRCYQRHAQRQEEAKGAVNLELMVNWRGRVARKSVKVKAPGVRGAKLSRCVQRSVYRWRFPTRREKTIVQYPLRFQHTHAPGAGPTKR